MPEDTFSIVLHLGWYYVILGADTLASSPTSHIRPLLYELSHYPQCKDLLIWCTVDAVTV